MARARNIKPGFFTNEELVELPFSTRLLFIGLWTVADREGRLEDKPKRIKMHLFPADDIDVDAALCQLEASGFLARYEVNGARYIQVLAFRKHQNPHRDEKASLIPAPVGHGASTVQAPDSNDGNRADSPIPDSLNLIPETTTGASAPAEGGEGGLASPEVESPKAAPLPARQELPEIANPALALTVALRPLGVSALSTHPTVIAWAQKGVSLDVLTEAVRIAREHKGEATIAPNYLAPIVDRLLNPPLGAKPGVRAAPAHSQKFNFADVDRTGDRAAMEASMARHGIAAGDIDDDEPL
ncbi:hypothetical protein [Massilia sp. METH4]|uniref:hypothetical protein n=1 Tax=Massilia sp. METH4 TaxID=3123041 RepID=UPI0030D42202